MTTDDTPFYNEIYDGGLDLDNELAIMDRELNVVMVSVSLDFLAA
jgi:hypothetical protein